MSADQGCLVEGCVRKPSPKLRGYCVHHHTEGLREGWLERLRGPFGIHGSSGSRQRGCTCGVCCKARADVLKRSRDKYVRQVLEGTYTGSHGMTCYRYGCRCEAAQLAKKHSYERESQQRKEHRAAALPPGVRTAMSEVGEVLVKHWPPRGVGMWTCPECGDQVPHRPPT